MDTHEFNPARGAEGTYKHDSHCVLPFGGGSTDRDQGKGHFHKVRALRKATVAVAYSRCRRAQRLSGGRRAVRAADASLRMESARAELQQ
jgi:hypothetical protein